jgi:predicted lipid carrier protein YhbT
MTAPTAPAPWSEAWIAALDMAARADEGLREASRGRHVVISQEVRDGDVVHRWHVALDDGDVAVRAGAATAADVTFSQDADTARAVAAGELAARTAFVMGRIRMGGDVSVLLDLAPALVGLGDVFGAVRGGDDDDDLPVFG